MTGISDDSDEVIRELDVFVTNNLDLHLIQFPLKPVYSDPINAKNARFKPNHKKLEIDITFPGNIIPKNEGRSEPPEFQTFTSSVVAHNTSLAAGIIHDNKFYIVPVADALQLRPSFQNLIQKIETVEDIDDEPLDDDNNNEQGEGLQQVQLKRKESERAQSARVQSYTHLMVLFIVVSVVIITIIMLLFIYTLQETRVIRAVD